LRLRFPLIAPTAFAIVLVKPQFEVGREGVVRVDSCDEAAQLAAV